MSRPRLLDLFCCEGGAAAGYHAAGFDVLGVDVEPQPRYPHTFVEGDAIDFAIEHGSEYDAIHASPPCQVHSVTGRYTPGDDRGHVDLVGPTRSALETTGRPWVIENVVGAPLRTDLRLCGTGFGLKLIRHRIFESNVYLGLAPPCSHASKMQRPHNKFTGDPADWHGEYVSPTGNPNARKGSLRQWREEMRMPWASRHGVTQAIPPAYAEFIGRALIAHLAA